MPVYIRKIVGERFENFADIAEDEWDLTEQVQALEEWLVANAGRLGGEDQWVADIGFGPREGELGGGPLLTQRLMQLSLEANLEILLSEFPATVDAQAVADELRSAMDQEVEEGSKAMELAERYLLAEADDDLQYFRDSPSNPSFLMAALQKELFERIRDPKARRIHVLRSLYDALQTAGDGLPEETEEEVEHVTKLIDALRAPEEPGAASPPLSAGE